MKVFIANFGRGNFLWPDCQRRKTIATVDDVDVHGFWERRDRDGYIQYTLTHKMTVRGETPTKPVASRWYGIMEAISGTTGDLWIHREKEGLWWTTSTDQPLVQEIHPSVDPAREGPTVYQLHKPCEPWSERTRKGAPLLWKGLHPRAREFLFTEGTLQQLSAANAEYAEALVNGDDLTPWHSLPDWKAKVGKAGKGAVTHFDSRARAIWRMVNTVKQTVSGANGQQVLRTMKNKELRFDDESLKSYIEYILTEQGGLCALTDIPVQFDGDCEEPELLCSLDRIDSEGHYEAGNLQIVCKFANRWKGASKDDEFKRLIGVIRNPAL